MRDVNLELITEVVKYLSIEASTIANDGLVKSLQKALKTEASPVGVEILEQLLENIEIAKTEKIPICQDTGFTVVYADIGQDVHFVGGDFNEAINKGVAQG
jgi:fumarate hydratase subunit alpha